MTYNWKKAIAERPTFEQRDAYYGAYSYRDLPGGLITPNAAWESKNLTSIIVAKDLPGFPKLYGQQTVKSVRMHVKVAPIFIASWAEAVRLGLASTLHSYDGCYNPRHMQNNPAMPLSNHSKGTAIDLDASGSRMGLPIGKMSINMRFVELMERLGWAWGGRWKYTDGMHFEWVKQYPGLAPAHQDSILSGQMSAPVIIKPAPIVIPAAEKDYPSIDLNNAVKLIHNGVEIDGNIDKATFVNGKIYVNSKKGA